MAASQFLDLIPTIILIEGQTFASELMANSLRGELTDHTILLRSSDLVDVENLRSMLRLVIITNSVVSHSNEKVKILDRLKNISYTAPIVVLGDPMEEGALSDFIDFNLRGVFPDATPTNIVIAGLKFILAGGEYFPHKFNNLNKFSGNGSQALEQRTAAILNSGNAFETTHLFTERERTVLRCLAKGQANKVIAGHLAIAENTIKVHIRNILKKLNVSNRTEAVMTAQKLNLLELQ